MENKEIFHKILQKADGMIGEVAYGQAREIEGVEIKEKEVVTEISEEQLNQLLEKFKDIMGQGAYGVFRQSIQEIYGEDSSVAQVNLPEKAVPKEVRAEKFASAL